MNHLSLYNTIKINFNTAIDNIIGRDEKKHTKTANSIVEEQNDFYDINSLHWDEYGNPYIY
jgi:hypothetical protein